MPEQDTNPFDLLASLKQNVDTRVEKFTPRQQENFVNRQDFWVGAFVNVLNAIKADAMSVEEASNTLGRYTAMEAVLRRIDPLTQLWDKEAITEIGESALSHAISSHEALTVAMLDFDKFKRVNDTHGHAVGDEALRNFSQIVSGLIRDQDFLGRCGGEEFMLVMPDLTQEEAEERLETIREQIETKLSSSITSKKIDHPLTVSIGYGEYIPGANLSFKTLKGHADEALYVAKGEWKVKSIPETGRNRVVRWRAGFN